MQCAFIAEANLQSHITDINKSGYNILLAFIPLVGAIILLVYLCSDSVRKNNIYKSKRKAV